MYKNKAFVGEKFDKQYIGIIPKEASPFPKEKKKFDFQLYGTIAFIGVVLILIAVLTVKITETLKK